MTPTEHSHGPLRYRDGQPVFLEQWHAQVIALVEVLVSEGAIAPSEWSKTLGAELDKRSENGDPDDDATYYGAFLAALEGIVSNAGLASRTEVNQREKDWRCAYLSTPHGQPVILEK